MADQFVPRITLDALNALCVLIAVISLDDLIILYVSAMLLSFLYFLVWKISSWILNTPVPCFAA